MIFDFLFEVDILLEGEITVSSSWAFLLPNGDGSLSREESRLLLVLFIADPVIAPRGLRLSLPIVLRVAGEVGGKDFDRNRFGCRRLSPAVDLLVVMMKTVFRTNMWSSLPSLDADETNMQEMLDLGSY